MYTNGIVRMGGGGAPQFSGLFSPAGSPKGQCVASPDGLAFDRLAALFGCPDCPGQASLAPGLYKTWCYWIRRPLAQVALIAGLGFAVYLMMKE
jgi:hypothetical protein